MKIILFFLTILLLAVTTGCRKENQPVKNNSQMLPGRWELRTSYGNRRPETFYEPGNGNLFVFTDHNYSLLSPDVLTKNGTYTLTTAPNPNTGEDMTAIGFDGNSLGTVCYSLKNDVLTFYWSPLAACGSISTYTRIADAGNTPGNP